MYPQVPHWEEEEPKPMADVLKEAPWLQTPSKARSHRQPLTGAALFLVTARPVPTAVTDGRTERKMDESKYVYSFQRVSRFNE